MSKYKITEANRAAFKAGYAACEAAAMSPTASMSAVLDSMPQDDTAPAWASGYNFACVMVGIAKMSPETELAVLMYEPEYFSVNAPEFPEFHKHNLVMIAQQKRIAQLSVAPIIVDDGCNVSAAQAMVNMGMVAADHFDNLPKGGGLLGASVRKMIVDQRAATEPATIIDIPAGYPNEAALIAWLRSKGYDANVCDSEHVLFNGLRAGWDAGLSQVWQALEAEFLAQLAAESRPIRINGKGWTWTRETAVRRLMDRGVPADKAAHAVVLAALGTNVRVYGNGNAVLTVERA